jgi:hypothetical protein
VHAADCTPKYLQVIIDLPSSTPLALYNILPEMLPENEFGITWSRVQQNDWIEETSPDASESADDSSTP